MPGPRKTAFERQRRKYSRHGKSWTPEEDQLLVKVWDSSQRLIASHFPHRSWSAIRARAASIGLPFGAPQGYESVAAASVRLGFTASFLLRLCKEKKLPFVLGSSKKRNKSSRIRYADPDEYDRVFELFMKCTTVTYFCNYRRHSRDAVTKMIRKHAIEPVFCGRYYLEEDLVRIMKDIQRTSPRTLAVMQNVAISMWGNHPCEEILKETGMTIKQLEKCRENRHPKRPPHMKTVGSLLYLRHKKSMGIIRRMVIEKAPHEMWWCSPKVRRESDGKEYDGFAQGLYIDPKLVQWIEANLTRRIASGREDSDERRQDGPPPGAMCSEPTEPKGDRGAKRAVCSGRS